MSRLPLIDLSKVAPSASNKRLTCYIVLSITSFICGTTAQPRSFWDWVHFFAGMTGSAYTAYRAFIDLTQGRQDPPPDATDAQKAASDATPQPSAVPAQDGTGGFIQAPVSANTSSVVRDINHLALAMQKAFRPTGRFLREDSTWYFRQ